MNIRINHYKACKEAVVKFSGSEKINIRTSDKFYLANPEFASTPWPFSGLPVVYVFFNKQGKALYVGMSKNSSGQNNYIKVESKTGEGVEKTPWPMGKPHHMIFYCLSDQPLNDNEKIYRQMLSLRRNIREAIKKETTPPTWPSVASLMKRTSVSDICLHLPWISSGQAAELEVWYQMLSDDTVRTMTAEYKKYYLLITSFDFGNSLPKIDCNMVIKNTEDDHLCIPLDNQVKDFAFISKLAVYSENPESAPWQTVLNIILKVSGIQLNPDD